MLQSLWCPLGYHLELKITKILYIFKTKFQICVNTHNSSISTFIFTLCHFININNTDLIKLSGLYRYLFLSPLSTILKMRISIKWKVKCKNK